MPYNINSFIGSNKFWIKMLWTIHAKIYFNNFFASTGLILSVTSLLFSTFNMILFCRIDLWSTLWRVSCSQQIKGQNLWRFCPMQELSWFWKLIESREEMRGKQQIWDTHFYSRTLNRGENLFKDIWERENVLYTIIIAITYALKFIFKLLQKHK